VTSIPGKAVSARFSGSSSGEVVIVIGQNIATALESSPLGALDVEQALRPALEAAAQAIGPVVLSPAQALDAAPALDALLAKPDAAVVPLLAGGVPMGAVGIVVLPSTPGPAPAGSPASPASPASPPASNARAAEQFSSLGMAGIDLLRGVEMDVTAELGRTRMSLNELLSLSDGAVIELDRAAGAPADLLVNGRLIARGEVVVIDESFGLRITEIVADGTAR
jgi:flagellar motor switch protein FliN/FliY